VWRGSAVSKVVQAFVVGERIEKLADRGFQCINRSFSSANRSAVSPRQLSIRVGCIHKHQSAWMKMSLPEQPTLPLVPDIFTILPSRMDNGF